MLRYQFAYPETDTYREVQDFARFIYGERHGITNDPRPRLFVALERDGQIVGCFGLYGRKGSEDRLFSETWLNQTQRATLAALCIGELTSLCEFGTRCVDRSALRGTGVSVTDVSVILTAHLVCAAQRNGFRHALFTGNRTTEKITDRVGIHVNQLGNPDFSLKDDAFMEEWASMFKPTNICCHFSIAQCYAAAFATLRGFDDVLQPIRPDVAVA